MSSPELKQTVEPVLRQLTARSGLVFRGSRRADAEAAVARFVTEAGAGSPAGLAAEVESGARSLDVLIERLIVGETYFFRDPAQFDFIRERIVPDLIASRPPHHALRIWSAGCSSGEEAYSLAILLAEMGLLRTSRILATDIARTSLRRAQEARYAEWSFRGCPPGIRERYFVRSGRAFVLRDDIRRHVRFERLNLALDFYPSPLSGTADTDLILLRNVLIYFGSETVAEVARRMFESLAEGGWLVAGASDPALSGYAPFNTVVTERGIFYRRPPRQTSLTVVPENVIRTQLDSVAAPSRSASPAVPSESQPLDAVSAAARVRSIADRGAVEEAEREALAMTMRFPLSADIHFIRAVLLVSTGRDDEALEVLRKVIYLDGELAIAHFLTGVVLQRRGAVTDAMRAYRNAEMICARHSRDEAVPLADGEIYESLLAAIQSHLRLISGTAEGGPS